MLKILSSALVVMKGKKYGNLYFLQGCTFTCNSLVSTKEKKYSTRLWNMRLGHVGEKSMTVLSKQGLLKGAESCKLDFCEHCVLCKQTWV